MKNNAKIARLVKKIMPNCHPPPKKKSNTNHTVDVLAYPCTSSYLQMESLAMA